MTDENRMMEFAQRESAAASKAWGARVSDQKRRKAYGPASGITGFVVSVAADVFGVPCDDIYSSSRKANVSEARQAVMYVLRTDFDVSLAQIGRDLNRDHTSVMHGVSRANELRMESWNFNAALDEISARVDSLRKPVFYRHGSLEFKSKRG